MQISKVPGILSVHELHVWKLSGNKIIATGHITFHNSAEYMRIATDLKAFFHKKGIHSTTFQPEFTDPIEGVDRSTSNCILECKRDCNPNTCCGQNNSNNSGVLPDKTSKEIFQLTNLAQPTDSAAAALNSVINAATSNI